MNFGDPASGDRLPEIGSDQFRGEGARVVRPYLRTSAVGPSGKTPPPALSAALNMRGLLRGVWRNLGVALGLGLLLATAAAVATWFGVPSSKYSARSMLLVSATPPKLALDTKDREPGRGGAVRVPDVQEDADGTAQEPLRAGQGPEPPQRREAPLGAPPTRPGPVARGRAHRHLRRRAALHRAPERRSAGGGQAGQRRDRRLPGRGRQRRQQSTQGTPRANSKKS